MTDEFSELDRSFRIIAIWTISILFGALLLMFITPAHSMIAGFILGALISLYNAWHIARRMKLIGKTAISGTVRTNTGLFMRVLAVITGVFFVSLYPEWFDYRSFLLGLTLCYIMMYFVAFYRAFKYQREGRVRVGNHSEN